MISHSITSDVASPQQRNITIAAWAKLVLALVSTAAAMMFGLQALLHFHNLPTLMMLTVSVFF
jgi:hypothetical protein